MNAKVINECIKSCDERISSIQEKLNEWIVYGKVLSIVSFDLETKYQDKLKNYENNIKLIKTEKLIYNALMKSNNSELFPKLLARYDELMGVSYDLSGNMVITGLVVEGDYLDYCKQSLDQREYIRTICSIGEHRNI
jgi:hypothetical protein